MRISDWSSDVCSSDLLAVLHAGAHNHAEGGELEESEDQADDHQRERQVDQAPPRIDDGIPQSEQRADGGGAGDRVGRGGGNGIGAEECFDDLLQHDGEAEGDQYLRSEEHTSELQSLMRISYAVFCLKKKNKQKNKNRITQQ